ncbi:hypothetical protein C8F01DRAFT_997753 [Mycena amicta]|nr:hypothetical protein C8F01DRAFT_997753 [Mycena amicta]
MPKGAPGARSRGPYASQACTVCRARKSKCDGVRPVCSPCVSFGRETECSWGKETAVRRPKTEAHFEALQKLNDALHAHIEDLEAKLAKCVCQDKSSSLQFRPPPPQLDEEESDADVVESSEEDITKELAIPAQRLKLDDELGGGLALQGSTTPLRFEHRTKASMSPQAMASMEDDAVSYVLLVDGVDEADAHPSLDWSRHLPQDVKISRRDHDIILDLSFKFWTGWGLRAAPSLLLTDMYRALSSPPSDSPPKTPSYSPMYHNAMLSVCAVFSTNPHIRDQQTRLRFADQAKQYLEDECKSPQISLIHALSFLGTFYADLGQRIVADLYVGMSSRVSMTLGLEVDSTPWMESGLITREEMLARHWTHCALCFRDVDWALFIGRQFCGPPMDMTRAPFVDEEADSVPWFYAPAKIPPQPNLITATFRETFALSFIGRMIIDIVYVPWLCAYLYLFADLLNLHDWKNTLPAALEMTPANRAKSTPYRLMLHCEYWSYFIFLHRPFFSRKSQSLSKNDREVDHVKLCKRAAENILDICATWSKVYGLKHAPPALFQPMFSAGTIHMLLALQATSSARIAHVALQTALGKTEECIGYLHEMGETWMSAGRIGDILQSILREKLNPIIERRLAQKAGNPPTMVVDVIPPGNDPTTTTTGMFAPPPSFSEQQHHIPTTQLPQPQAQTWHPGGLYGEGAGWSADYSLQYSGPLPPAGMNEAGYSQQQQLSTDLDIAAFLPNFDFGAPQYWIRQEPLAFKTS